MTDVDRKICSSGSHGKPRDVEQWPSDRFYYPHQTVMKDSYVITYLDKIPLSTINFLTQKYKILYQATHIFLLRITSLASWFPSFTVAV